MEATDDITLVVEAIASEEALGLFCSAAEETHPTLSTLAKPVRIRSKAHASLLRNALVNVEPARSSRPDRIPGAEQAARARLLARIAQAEQQRLTDCLASQSGPLARVFASMSASHAASAAQIGTAVSGADG
ncbi:MAG: hypothetical protein WKF73_20570 [Nocardioidaceae bacterium]